MIPLETRILDGVLFFVERTGRKETLHTPAQLIDVALTKIDMIMADIRAGIDKTKALQRLVENALITCENAAGYRDTLEAQNAIDKISNESITAARKCIYDIFKIQDAQRATESRNAMAARLAAITNPFDTILKDKA